MTKIKYELGTNVEILVNNILTDEDQEKHNCTQFFIQQYYDYIEPELLDKLDNLEKLTIEGSYNEQYKQVLEKKYIAVDMGENSQLDKLHDLQSLLKQKINESRDEFVTTTQSPQIIHPENIIRYVNPHEKID